jgi:hypothetical protein
MIHTLRSAKALESAIQQRFDKQTKIIGSIGKGMKCSEHDIDILLPSLKYSKRLHTQLNRFLNAESSERTDWNGIFFHNTTFGNVDVFFTTEDFTY